MKHFWKKIEEIYEQISNGSPKDFFCVDSLRYYLWRTSWLEFSRTNFSEKILKNTLKNSLKISSRQFYGRIIGNISHVTFQNDLSNIEMLLLFTFSLINDIATFTSSVAFFFVWNANHGHCRSAKLPKGFSIALL